MSDKGNHPISKRFEKFLSDWQIKLICFIVAVFLYIFHQSSLIVKKTFVVPLQIQESGLVMHVGNVPSSVNVIVRTTEENINSISHNDITATVNLDMITSGGRYSLPVEISLSNKLKEMDPLEIRLPEPETFINTELRVTKYVDVKASQTGEVAHGYKVDSIEMSPSTVEISGPESIVNAVNEIHTTKVNVSNAETNFASEVYYREETKYIEVKDLGPYKATVIISPQPMEKEYSGVTVEVLNLSDKLMLATRLPELTLKLSGDVPVLEKYILSKHAVQLNLSDVEEAGDYEKKFRVNLPSNLKLEEISMEGMVIRVEEKPEDLDSVENQVENGAASGSLFNPKNMAGIGNAG